MIAFYVDFYYNVIIAWALYYFFASFSSELPWTRCNNPWNTKNCSELRTIRDDLNGTFMDSSMTNTNRTSPAMEYYRQVFDCVKHEFEQTFLRV